MAEIILKVSPELRKKLDREYLEAVSTATGINKELLFCIAEGKPVSSIFQNIESLPISSDEKGRLKAHKIASTFERLDREKKDETIIKDPSDIAKIVLPSLKYESVEHFQVAYMNTKGRLIDIAEISKGGATQASISPKEIFKKAVDYNADIVILIHNHPSMDPTPSGADINITQQMVEAGQILGIEVVDHLIIGSTYHSMRESNPEIFYTMNINAAIRNRRENDRFTLPAKETTDRGIQRY